MTAIHLGVRRVAGVLTFVLVALPAASSPATAGWWTPKIRHKDPAAAPPTANDSVPSTTAPAPPPPTAAAQGATPQATPTATSTTTAPASTAPAAAPAATTTTTKEQKQIDAAREEAAPTAPDESLKDISAKLRQGPIAKEPNALVYLDLIDAGQATPAQVNDFATYLGKRGMPRIALSYQQYALRLDRKDPTLWLNLGTLESSLGRLSSAETAYKTTIDLDPNNALAHYNLGAIYDLRGSYDAAIEEYRRALVLDPDLGDARKNPQVVNNDHLMAVKLQIYRNQAGAFGLPLIQMQKPEPGKGQTPAKPDEKH